MTKRRKSSKCPEPINTLLDIAGAATLGLYVKHKVKKDAERNQQRLPPWSLVWGLCAEEAGVCTIWAA